MMKRIELLEKENALLKLNEEYALKEKEAEIQVQEEIICAQSDEIKVLKSQLKAKDAEISEHKAKEERERLFNYLSGCPYQNPRGEYVKKDGSFWFYRKLPHVHLYEPVSEDEFLRNPRGTIIPVNWRI